jgi:hypothetical protein
MTKVIKNIKIYKETNTNLFSSLFIFFLILNSSTSYLSFFSWFSKVTIILAFCSYLLMLFFLDSFSFYRKPLLIFQTLILSVLLTSTFTDFSIEAINYIFKILLCVSGLSIMAKKKIGFFNTLFNVTKVFLIWAFLCEIYTFIGKDFLPITNTYYTTWGEARHIYLFFIFKNISGFYAGSHLIMRMHAPFSEPGVSQLFFNFGLFYSLFYLNKKKEKIKWMFLFSLGVILCLSLAGVAILCLLYTAFLFSKKNKIIYPILVLIFVLFVFLAINKKNTESSFDRISDLENMINTIISSFPFGKGIGNYETSRYVATLNRTFTDSNFCGLLSPLLYLGLFSIPYYLILLIGIKYQSLNFEPMGAIFGLLVLMTITLFTQPMAFNPFVILIMSNGLIVKYRRKTIEQNLVRFARKKKILIYRKGFIV